MVFGLQNAWILIIVIRRKSLATFVNFFTSQIFLLLNWQSVI